MNTHRSELRGGRSGRDMLPSPYLNVDKVDLVNENIKLKQMLK